MNYIFYKRITYLIITILILVILWLSIRYNTVPEEINPYYSEFNKLISGSNNSLFQVDSILINPNQIDTEIKLYKYIFKVKLVEIQIINKSESTILSKAYHYIDNERIITVYIEYNGYISTIILTGKFDNYNNLYTSSLKIDENTSQYHDIYYWLSIKQIYIHDQTEDWYNLILSLNRNVQSNNHKVDLHINALNQPIRTNLLNPIEELLNYNSHAYNTPKHLNFDKYGFIKKKNKDNINKTIAMAVK